VPNLSEIEQSAAELRRFKYLKFGADSQIGFYGRYISILVRPPCTHNSLTFQVHIR